MIEQRTKLSECLCCLKKCIRILDNEQFVIRFCLKLFSWKINVTDETRPCICYKCYLRLKLCYAFRTPFANLFNYFNNPVPLHETDFVPRFHDISIISHCPVCFSIQPSTTHIYEHLSHSDPCRGCGLNCDNLLQHYEVSPKCKLLDENLMNREHVYYCNGDCGASFKRSVLRDIHQRECEHAQKEIKSEVIEEIYRLSSPVSNSSFHMDNDSVTTEMQDLSNKARKRVANKAPTARKRTISRPQNAKRQRTHVSQNPQDYVTTIHVTTAGTIRTYYERHCPVCGKWVKNLRIHLLTHNSSRQYQCKFCQKTLRTELTLKQHEAYTCRQRDNGTSELSEKPFSCDICGKSYACKLFLSKHMRSHAKFPCSLCKEMINKDTASAHMIKKHGGTEKWPSNTSGVCHLCGKSFKNRSTFRAHFYIHHNTSVKSYECDKCDKKFKMKCHFETHYITHQVGEKEHLCKVCGRTFFTNNSLNAHIKTVHKKDGSRTCSVCGQTLSSLNTLRVHERQHTGVKPYACDICAKTFTQKPPLNRHMRSQHGIMPPLVEKCPQCDKMFASKTVLKAHMVRMH